MEAGRGVEGGVWNGVPRRSHSKRMEGKVCFAEAPVRSLTTSMVLSVTANDLCRTRPLRNSKKKENIIVDYFSYVCAAIEGNNTCPPVTLFRVSEGYALDRNKIQGNSQQTW